jgi:hypothetical protein
VNPDARTPAHARRAHHRAGPRLRAARFAVVRRSAPPGEHRQEGPRRPQRSEDAGCSASWCAGEQPSIRVPGCASSHITITDDHQGWNTRSWTAECNGDLYYCMGMQGHVSRKQATGDEVEGNAPKPAVAPGGCDPELELAEAASLPSPVIVPEATPLRDDVGAAITPDSGAPPKTGHHYPRVQPLVPQ